MIIYRIIARLGMVKSTLILTALCVLLSLFVYLIVAIFFTDSFSNVGVFMSVVTPALAEPAGGVILLRMTASLFMT
ncbi:MAG: hypothetical protein NT178_08715 [Proteobacteria bacterium]|nr:hypothetical protein [Pseudomonadota bacterium]